VFEKLYSKVVETIPERVGTSAYEKMDEKFDAEIVKLAGEVDELQKGILFGDPAVQEQLSDAFKELEPVWISLYGEVASQMKAGAEMKKAGAEMKADAQMEPACKVPRRS